MDNYSKNQKTGGSSWRHCCRISYRTAGIIFLALLSLWMFISHVHTETYVWQCTRLSNKYRPVKRSSCMTLPPYNPKVPKKYKIALLLIYDNTDGTWDKGLMDRVIQNRQIYCQKHGYELIMANNMIDKSRPAAWSKLLAMKYYLSNEDFDYIIYIDMDAIIMNDTIRIDQFVNLSNNSYDLIMSEDWSGLNTGIWIARKSRWTIWFLETAWNQKQLVQKTSTRGISYPFEYEQRAFHYLLNTKKWSDRNLPIYKGNITEIRSHLFYLPQCALNSYILHPLDNRGDHENARYVDGDFIVHFAGKKGKNKMDLMDYYLKKVDL